MSQPQGAPDGDITALVRAALSPGLHQISIKELRRTGLHREMLAAFYDAFQPEIQNLTGWNPLASFEYSTRNWSHATTEDVRRSDVLTSKWRQELDTLGLSHAPAILMFDGEVKPPPAPDYRLFLLQDGRIMYYEGGFHARRYQLEPPICSDALTVLDAVDKRYPRPYFSSADTTPFVIMMRALAGTLETAINHHKKQVAARESLLGHLQATVQRLTS